jgi:hypothetical protein
VIIAWLRARPRGSQPRHPEDGRPHPKRLSQSPQSKEQPRPACRPQGGIWVPESEVVVNNMDPAVAGGAGPNVRCPYTLSCMTPADYRRPQLKQGRPTGLHAAARLRAPRRL